MNNTVFARMKQEHAQLVREVCDNRGEDVSDFIRRAVLKELASLSYLSEAEKKSLGMRE